MTVKRQNSLERDCGRCEVTAFSIEAITTFVSETFPRLCVGVEWFTQFILVADIWLLTTVVFQ